MPSLTFTGATRLQIEAVRIHNKYRGQGIGKKMISEAIKHGINHGASIIQLTTNKQRKNAINFYQDLGFKATHEGMELYLG
ncbi:GNAT family N-acetyltransferase (plasmid) [Legionella sp. D16C41]|uniref:GNAT family N-acetyltransferase n=1 Tax=Legionella sp. D16C41 TaxID=3402688 RepID=UPI003AF64086